MADDIKPQTILVVSRSVAKAMGMKTYMPTKPCKRGHAGPRTVRSGSCIECDKIVTANKSDDLRLYKSAWYERNKDRLKPIYAEYYAANRVHYSDQSKALRAIDPEKNKQKCASYRLRKLAENPNYEKDRYPKRREYRLANAEKFQARHAAYRAAHPEEGRVYNANRMARKRGAVGKHTKKEIAYLLIAQRHRCGYCRILIRTGFHSDHIVAICRGGSNMISNIQLLCRSCNQRKHAKDPIIFAREIGLLI